MAAAGTTPDAWKEVCLIDIIPQAYPSGAGGGTASHAEAFTEDITGIEFGDKDIEGIPTLKGGRIVKYTPMADESITLKVHPVDNLIQSNGTSSGVSQWFHPQSTEDSTQPILVDNTIDRRKFGIIILWAETLPANASTLPAESKAAYRIQIRNAYMTSYKPSYDDKHLTAEITFKWTPFDKNASANKREESTDGSSQLSAAMTSATSF